MAALEKDAEEARSAERRHRAFLDVLTATCGDDLDTAKGHAEAAELRKEVERLREEVAGLRGGAEGEQGGRGGSLWGFDWKRCLGWLFLRFTLTMMSKTLAEFLPMQ